MDWNRRARLSNLPVIASAKQNRFPRGEAVERSETDEECGRKSDGLLNVADLLPRKDFEISLDVVQNYRVSPEFLIRPPSGATFPPGEGNAPFGRGERIATGASALALTGGSRWMEAPIKSVCHPDWSEAEWRDLRTDFSTVPI